MANRIFHAEEHLLCRITRKVCEMPKNERESEISESFNRVYLDGIGRYCDKYDSETGQQSYYDTICEAEKEINSFILPDAEKKKYADLLTQLEDKHREMLDGIAPFRPFPNREAITAYLAVYYRLLKELLYLSDYLEDFDRNGVFFVEKILNLDAEASYASLYSPPALDGLLYLYECVEEYWVHTEHTEGAILRSNYCEVVITKLLRKFRWIVVRNGELMHAAIPPALKDEWKKEACSANARTLDIPTRKLEEYNSYEGIGELRLFDKILYEIEKRAANGDLGRELRVSLVGDIDKKPVETLCNLIATSLRKNIHVLSELPENFAEIHLRLYTYNEPEMKEEQPVNQSASDGISDGVKVYYRFIQYNGHLMRYDDLVCLVNESDMLFVLDSLDLYRNLSVRTIDDNNLLQQMVNHREYSVMGPQSRGMSLYSEKMEFALLREYLTAYTYQSFGKPGVFYKKINNTLLKEIERQISKSGEAKAAYIYVSDVSAIDSSDYMAENIIRKECYNEKEFLILQMTNRKEHALINTDDSKIMVFNVWQIIKHTAVRNIGDILHLLHMPDSCNSIIELKQTLIGLDYSNWRCKIVFYYKNADSVKGGKIKEKSISDWLKEAVLPFFSNHPRDMFYNYFVKSFSTFLYSSAKNVSDMLFLHIFEKKHDLLAEAVLSGEKLNLSMYLSRSCKYANKQFYYETMNDYDTPSSSFPFQYRKLSLIEQSDTDLRKNIFVYLRDVCEEDTYTDSYLYRNIS
ncbi:MAG: hypothetical protein LIO79_09700 [Rikenellaceae bacterium]|nr:hypothetical protein [Rikenellaceae bacterium]